MTSKRLHGMLIGVLVVLGLGILLCVRQADGILSKHSADLVQLKAQDQALTNKQAQITKDKQDIAKYADLNTIAKTVVPQDKDQAEAVRQIVNLAAQSGISSLSSIAFQPSTLGGATTKKIQTGNGLTQVTPVKGIPGVYDLQITVSQATTSTVPYDSFTSFLKKLEKNRRTAQVSSINIQPDQKNPTMVSFTLVIDEFIKP